jgi:hypothetical protein
LSPRCIMHSWRWWWWRRARLCPLAPRKASRNLLLKRPRGSACNERTAMPVPSPWSERSDSACRSYSHDLGSLRELLAGRERELALATADLTALRAHVADLRAEQRLALDQMSERLLAVSGTAESAADVARAAKQAGQAASAELRALSEECAGVKEALVRLERRQVRRAPSAWRLLRATWRPTGPCSPCSGSSETSAARRARWRRSSWPGSRIRRARSRAPCARSQMSGRRWRCHRSLPQCRVRHVVRRPSPPGVSPRRATACNARTAACNRVQCACSCMRR